MRTDSFFHLVRGLTPLCLGVFVACSAAVGMAQQTNGSVTGVMNAPTTGFIRIPGQCAHPGETPVALTVYGSVVETIETTLYAAQSGSATFAVGSNCNAATQSCQPSQSSTIVKVAREPEQNVSVTVPSQQFTLQVGQSNLNGGATNFTLAQPLLVITGQHLQDLYSGTGRNVRVTIFPTTNMMTMVSGGFVVYTNFQFVTANLSFALSCA